MQLSGIKRANIRCFYIAKNDLVAVTQKSVQLSGSCNYPACYYPETTVLLLCYTIASHNSFVLFLNPPKFTCIFNPNFLFDFVSPGHTKRSSLARRYSTVVNLRQCRTWGSVPSVMRSSSVTPAQTRDSPTPRDTRRTVSQFSHGVDLPLNESRLPPNGTNP